MRTRKTLVSKIVYPVTTVVLLLVASAASAQLKTLHSFDFTDGADPNGWLIQGSDGNLYGTTASQGANGYGTVFKISPAGNFVTLYDFCSLSVCADGAGPLAGLIQASDGNFYGTTNTGGANVYGGTVFKITPAGALTTLFSFCDPPVNCSSGYHPEAGLVQGSDGNLYGVTYLGGANGGGTVYRITRTGILTVTYNFPLGSQPSGTLIQATDGNLYGTTAAGGTYGYGTVFKISLSGSLTTLYSFCATSGCPDGEAPIAGLVQGSDGNFYGTTYFGGINLSGTIFKINAAGKLTTIYNFCSLSACSDGQYPEDSLIQAGNGTTFYGTASRGGANFYGTAFKVSSTGTMTTLYSFCAQSGCTDGQNPYANLMQDTNGSFYGTTFGGGSSSAGTVFSLSAGLGRFIETQPSYGKAGASIKILGTNLTGATSVTFNGTSATFTVNSSSLITATVPAGATTGFVQVATPGGTLKSNRKFLVR